MQGSLQRIMDSLPNLDQALKAIDIASTLCEFESKASCYASLKTLDFWLLEKSFANN